MNLLQSKTKNRKLIQLQPVLKNDLICVGGRLKHAQIPTESKHQVIIPSNHHLTYLLLLYIHQNNHHCGRDQLLGLSRERYWIVNGRHLAGKIIYNCLYCKQQIVKPQPQLMADLPPERLSYLQPAFWFTGVDYFGPVTVKGSYRTRSLSGHNKRYVCFFTCLTFRAIHLELCGFVVICSEQLSLTIAVCSTIHWVAQRITTLVPWKYLYHYQQF